MIGMVPVHAEAPRKGELFRRIVPRKFMRLVQTEHMRALENMGEYEDAVGGELFPGSEPQTPIPYAGGDDDGRPLPTLDGPEVSPVSAMRAATPETADQEVPLLANSSSARYRPSVRGGVGAPQVPERAMRPSTASSFMSVSSCGSLLRGPASPASPIESFLEGGEPDFEPRYLLVDIRTEDEYAECHLDGAVHFPAARLSRSCNVFTPELRRYKNKTDSIVIVYDSAEKRAPRVAQLLFQQGFNNVVLLVGGLKAMAEQFPDMILGTLPPDAVPSPPPSARRRRRRDRAPGTASTSASRLDESYASSYLSNASRQSDLSRLPGFNARTKGNISAWH
ncbi:uncharacterized protein AMSG_10344 [Thecamonas trahens ATCC 50062]|uniref:Rhodanese domain-containing protein n=1 Tax=Thecamonas trahens ATCC 50062 TaxID=461836 RepID=A0A0L0DQ05_THETB|nr:hypothetical protein AMSG_10344 [Thecamonas trahens ATCC 50062]KNC54350.1 hypothetical protein AMSG_10344 [Thecamonas trahens ATCC 50062]|eukprot:XP_013753805.1 hypothetical protein AMSG_10344 [Thecamonas trahens ATCC 50062]